MLLFVCLVGAAGFRVVVCCRYDRHTISVGMYCDPPQKHALPSVKLVPPPPLLCPRFLPGRQHVPHSPGLVQRGRKIGVLGGRVQQQPATRYPREHRGRGAVPDAALLGRLRIPPQVVTTLQRWSLG